MQREKEKEKNTEQEREAEEKRDWEKLANKILKKSFTTEDWAFHVWEVFSFSKISHHDQWEEWN